jgi:hypothetical protein
MKRFQQFYLIKKKRLNENRKTSCRGKTIEAQLPANQTLKDELKKTLIG